MCKADSLPHKKVLEKIGATQVVLPEKDMGAKLADSLMSRSETVLDHIGLSGNSSIIELRAPEEFIGKNLRELDIRAKYGVNVIALMKTSKVIGPDGEEVEEKKTNVTPQADDVVTKDDILVVFGENEKIEQIKNKG